MSADQVLRLSEAELLRTSKRGLLRMLREVCEQLQQERQAHRQEVAHLRARMAEAALERQKATEQKINQTVNQPSAKKAEWEKDPPRGRRKRRHRGRAGAGNRAKPEPDTTHLNPLLQCPRCDTDLSERPTLDTPARIVEDIAPPPEKTIVTEEIQERKWCPTCQAVVSSRSESALAKSDIGLRANVLIAYLWVVAAISLPGIVAYLKSFFRLRLSSAGLSRMLIRLGTILAPVQQEILSDLKGGAMIFADETGWRIGGELWWLWIFANSRCAYYWPDRQRGSPVVEKILGTIFSGVLVTDAWCAYHQIVCVKQTCMAHIFRKVRKFRDAYPQYWSLVCFYRRLRRLVRDGERLRTQRRALGEAAFERRLERLTERLDELLAWNNPNAVLKTVLEKVRRQRDYILTFVRHEGVPTHNNFGEYIIKRGILKRKVSGGSTSPAGAMAYARIQSVAMTCQLRGLSFHDYLLQSLKAYIKTGSVLLLADYERQQIVTEKKAA
ncbi:transposase IS66 [mine drainage metagenome]|uniref:Transposase IS66 n=3 Tax=mine drainage metagenome TaxID=410659 RepID=T1C1E5_9ZZZZ